jgi:hypothetical protein
MTKQIQSLEAWGYIVEPVSGSTRRELPPNEKHWNISHPRAVDPERRPINTFSVTNEDKTLLKIPRAFNDDVEFDQRPRSEKLSLREQIVSFWTLVEGRDLKDLKKMIYTSVIEHHIRYCMEEVYMMKHLDEFDPLELKPSDPAFMILLENTPFLASAQKMVEDHADKFAGKKIESVSFNPFGGFAMFDFTISFT